MLMEAKPNALPAVTVVVPVYNTPADKFRRCIDSVLRQGGAMECLLVNDGSTAPHIAQMLSEAAAADTRVRVINKENGGPSSARNRGIVEARGEWVTFVDADDTLSPGAVAMMAERASETGADVVIFAMSYGGCEKPTTARPQVAEGAALRQLIADAVGGLDTHERYGVSLVSPVARLVRRQLLIDTGLRFRQDIHIAEDLLFCVHAYRAARRVATDPRVVYDYVFDARSITHTPQPRFRLTAREFIVALAEFVEKHYNGDAGFKTALLRRVFPFAEVYASARFATSRSQGRSLWQCRLELAAWMSVPLVSESAVAVTPAELYRTGFGSRRNTLKLFRHRLATPYLLLMALQRHMARE